MLTTYKGYNGEITIEEVVLTISRTGLAARAAFGKNLEPVVIPLQAISGVRLKPATRLMNGWLHLLVGGEEAPELVASTATSNSHTVLFTHKNRGAFDELRRWLETVIAKNVADGVNASAFHVTAQGGHVGRFDRLTAKANTFIAQVAESETARKQDAGILFEGTSHDSGRNAKVTLYSDRLERVKEAKRSSFSSARQDVEVTSTRFYHLRTSHQGRTVVYEGNCVCVRQQHLFPLSPRRSQ